MYKHPRCDDPVPPPPPRPFPRVFLPPAALEAFLHDLVRFGLVILTGAPAEEGVLRLVGARVMYLRITSYGEIFTVKYGDSFLGAGGGGGWD